LFAFFSSSWGISSFISIVFVSIYGAVIINNGCLTSALGAILTSWVFGLVSSVLSSLWATSLIGYNTCLSTTPVIVLGSISILIWSFFSETSSIGLITGIVEFYSLFTNGYLRTASVTNLTSLISCFLFCEIWVTPTSIIELFLGIYADIKDLLFAF